MDQVPSGLPEGVGDEVAARTVRRVMLRLIPFIVLLYILNYIDRVNISFAKEGLQHSLDLSNQAYGFGAGVFFLSYFIFEVPSNLLMDRVGARRWLARIMISWGLISSAMMFVRGEWSFYALRFLLGAAEAGFAPGVLLYLTYWLPLKDQAKAVAWFLTSIALSGVIGSPLAGLILQLDGAALWGHALHGWQWLFFLEGIPSVLGGIATLLVLTDRPEQARWLRADERAWLTHTLTQERAVRGRGGHTSLGPALATFRVWHLCAIYCCIMFAFQASMLWLPAIIRDATGIKDDLRVCLLTGIPYAVAAVTMVLVARHSDRTGERRWHVAIACGASAAGFVGAALAGGPWGVMIGLSVALGAAFATLGPFWALPPAFLVGTAAAGGIAMVNAVGNLGGFQSSSLLGVLFTRTKGHAAGMLTTAGVMVLAGVLVVLLRKRK